MGKNKGCINENCIACQKKVMFKDDDEFCPKCGQQLTYVCHKCHKFIPDNSSKYCPNCEADIKDRKDKALNVGKIILDSAEKARVSVDLVAQKSKDFLKTAKNAKEVGAEVNKFRKDVMAKIPKKNK